MALNPNASVFNPAWSGGGGGRGGGRGGGGGLGGGGGGRGGGFGGRGGDDVGRKRKREKKPLTESQLLMKEIGESCRFSDVERGMAAYRAAKVAGTRSCKTVIAKFSVMLVFLNLVSHRAHPQ